MARVCVSQISLDIDRPDQNIKYANEAIHDAANQGAELIVLPELVNSGYMFQSIEEVMSRATTLDGPIIRAWLEMATKLEIIVVAGLALNIQGTIYNSSVVLSEAGFLGWYGKTHLFGDEVKYFTAGNSKPLIVKTRIGSIATMVCYDIEFPEWSRIAMLEGAQLIALPTNWPVLTQNNSLPPLEVIKSQANASMNKLVVAAADRVGTERGQEWYGASHVTDFDGNLLTYADTRFVGPIQNLIVDVQLPSNTKIAVSNDVRNDRKPNLYHRLVEEN